MKKSTLQAKLFLFYLRFKKPIIIFSALAATIIIGLDNWLKFRERSIDLTPWTITNIDNASSLIVTRNDATKTISLCGVASIENETKEYLISVISLGDGTVELEQVGNSYEAWISLKPGYNMELVKHVSNTPDELVEQDIHLNSWVIERGKARRNIKEASQCREPENLAWAETIAQEGKLGIWQDK